MSSATAMPIAFAPLPSTVDHPTTNGTTAVAHPVVSQPLQPAPPAATNGSAEIVPPPEPQCRHCSAPSISKCANCKQAYYCSVAHQKADWRRHKPDCHPFRIAHSEQFGRHLLAARDIRAGEIVLREAPLIRGPSQITGPVCVGCLQGLSEAQLRESAGCERCGWPVCSPQCQEAAGHAAECALTVSRGTRVSLQHYFAPHPTYQCITTLRCLLLRDAEDGKEAKESGSSSWSRLQQLESHCAERRGSVQWRNDREGVARFIPRFFRCDGRWSEEEILRAAGIVQINGHEVPLTEPAHVAIYHLASLVEHSCRPNLTKSFTATGEVVFWAAQAIGGGQHLSICYSDVLWGTANRQHHLQQTKLFRCRCERCVDVTEGGTWYSAVRCKKCEAGLMLPGSLDEWEEEWRCGVCELRVPYSYVAGVLERAGRDLEAMEKDSEENCIKYIEHYGRWLPGHHHMITDVKIALVQLIGSGGPHIIQCCTEDRLRLKVRYAQELLQLLARLAAAEARILGALHFELHAGLAELGRRGAALQTDSFRGALEESLHSAEEVGRLLQHEPLELSEGQLCAQARRNAESLRAMLAATATGGKATVATVATPVAAGSK